MNKLLFLLLQFLFHVSAFSWFSRTEYQRNPEILQKDGCINQNKLENVFLRPKHQPKTRRVWRSKYSELYGPIWK
ncbi:unnamed protein product [Caenorhabditis angaria]|uniref:Uncharacterized protein n=1 Tax=Caenorhabditis angaria TaxID=860376 RepID=A0A9P1IXI9_9PELO|nr:unnamed protein product [Caenorhabditis angaria]